MKHIWFKRKTFGWGWTPATWQGWIILAVYIYLLVLLFRSIDATSHSDSDTLIAFALPFIVLTLALMGICRLFGEKPRWSWGDDSEDKE